MIAVTESRFEINTRPADDMSETEPTEAGITEPAPTARDVNPTEAHAWSVSDTETSVTPTIDPNHDGDGRLPSNSSRQLSP